jgi:hypothetical protein
MSVPDIRRQCEARAAHLSARLAPHADHGPKASPAAGRGSFETANQSRGDGFEVLPATPASSVCGPRPDAETLGEVEG